MELLTDDIPDFMAPVTPPEAEAPSQPSPPSEPDGVDLTTLQGLIVLEVAAQLHARPVGYGNEGRITAITPKGFMITLVTRKETPSEVLTALEVMEKWCLSAHYQPTNGVPF